jgi:hypothetical protein
MEKIFFEHPWILIIIVLWTIPWKGAALWRAARRGHLGWFLTLLILNTFAILDILYIFIFVGWGDSDEKEKNKEPEIVEGPKVRQAQKSPNFKNKSTIV